MSMLRNQIVLVDGEPTSSLKIRGFLKSGVTKGRRRWDAFKFGR